jgi:hypothetical protein
MFHPECDFLSLANLVVVFAPLCFSLKPLYVQILEYSEDCAEAKLQGATLQAGIWERYWRFIPFGSHPMCSCRGAGTSRKVCRSSAGLAIENEIAWVRSTRTFWMSGPSFLSRTQLAPEI